MIKRGAEPGAKNDYSPDVELRKFLDKRLKLSQKMGKIRAGGDKIPPEIIKKNKSLATTKTRVLDKFVFPSWANMFYFFKMVAEHPELKETFDGEIKDMLGVRRYNPKTNNYGHVFSHLIAYILNIKITGKPLKKDDFRLRLIQIVQEIVIAGFQQNLPDILNDEERYNMMLADVFKAAAWIRSLADNVKNEDASPHKVFSFD